MVFATTKVVEVECRGETFTIDLKMVTMREKATAFTKDGQFDTSKFFELGIVKVDGPEINGKTIKTGADILDTEGLDELFLGVSKHLNNWDIDEDEIKNS